MSVDTSKLNFITRHSIDKVVQQGTVTIVNDGATTSATESKIVTETVPNDYGRAALARCRWRVDGGSWQGMTSQMVYTFTYTDSTIPSSDSTPGLKAAISIGCDDNFVYFRTANGLHGDVTYNGSTESYTPTSQTFEIEYALYERE